MIIVCAGTIRNGFNFYGPFNSVEEAKTFVGKLPAKHVYEIFQLIPPQML